MGLGMDKVVSMLKSLAKEIGITLHKKECQPLLKWILWWQLALTSLQSLQEAVLEVVGKELWESACIGNKEALSLLPAYGALKGMLEKLSGEVQLWATVCRLLCQKKPVSSSETVGATGEELYRGNRLEESRERGNSGERSNRREEAIDEGPRGESECSEGEIGEGKEMEEEADGTLWSREGRHYVCFPDARVGDGPLNRGTPAFVAPPPYHQNVVKGKGEEVSSSESGEELFKLRTRLVERSSVSEGGPGRDSLKLKGASPLKSSSEKGGQRTAMLVYIVC
ncbi:uncharacterized protein LOC116239359 [Phasianus colchicus]|uniref:uncharacterized protein LOC116239359 n=1 Tax=Phasianus colchicus TaxID=9054 RepID=UPI00129DB946|nr:uncharacterized protein LOC116239359 [Phasianus colchicus]